MIDTPSRQLEHWIQEVLIADLVSPGSSVCDFGCSGVDVGKWVRAKIRNYVGLSQSGESLNFAKERWAHKNYPFEAHWRICDPSRDSIPWTEGGAQTMDLTEHGEHPEWNVPLGGKGQFDSVVCFYGLEQAFQHESSARRMISAASSLLKPGGYFFGIVPDSSSLFTRAHKKAVGGRIKGSLHPSCHVLRI
jgi:mRNA (guanine-N7-)-methyltransferase